MKVELVVIIIIIIIIIIITIMNKNNNNNNNNNNNTLARENRVDARFVDHKAKKLLIVEMSCHWVDNRSQKDTKKTDKYGPLRLELSKLCPVYKITKLNFIIDVLSGWSKDLEKEMTCIFGKAGKQVLEIMLKAVLSITLNKDRLFKIMTE